MKIYFLKLERIVYSENDKALYVERMTNTVKSK